MFTCLYHMPRKRTLGNLSNEVPFLWNLSLSSNYFGFLEIVKVAPEICLFRFAEAIGGQFMEDCIQKLDL